MAVLDATCAWVNPGLVLVAIAVALLDLTAAVQRLAAMPSPSLTPARTVVVTSVAERCPPLVAPTVAPELREMMGHD